jgi:hypothetical protein
LLRLLQCCLPATIRSLLPASVAEAAAAAKVPAGRRCSDVVLLL